MQSLPHSKLAHLSKSQIDSLITRYYSGEAIKKLLIEYRIDCFPGQLHKLLPPHPIEGCCCPACGATMIQHRCSRSAISYRQTEIRCPQCGHRSSFNCWCTYCRKEKAEAPKRELNLKKEQIIEFCLSTQVASQDLAPVALSLRQAVSCLALVRCCTYMDSNNSHASNQAVLEPLENSTIPFAPTKELAFQLIAELMAAGIIGISEQSEADAFKFKDGLLAGYYPESVRWTLLAKAPYDFIKGIEKCTFNSSAWPSTWTEQITDIWSEIAFAECKEYYRHAAKERGFPESGELSTNAMLLNLIKDFSVAQCYRIIFSGSQKAADFLVRTGCSPKHAANYMIGACQRWGDRARAENWIVKGFRRNYDLPRSMLSYVLFDTHLKIGEAGFDSRVMPS